MSKNSCSQKAEVERLPGIQDQSGSWSKTPFKKYTIGWGYSIQF